MKIGLLMRRALAVLILLWVVALWARLAHLVTWPWWTLALPWAVLVGALVLSAAAVLVVVFIQEWRLAHEHARHRRRNSYHLEP